MQSVIKPGMPLYCYNYIQKTLIGGLEATSEVSLSIVRDFPALKQFCAQVRFKVTAKCDPISLAPFESATPLACFGLRELYGSRGITKPGVQHCVSAADVKTLNAKFFTGRKAPGAAGTKLQDSAFGGWTTIPKALVRSEKIPSVKLSVATYNILDPELALLPKHDYCREPLAWGTTTTGRCARILAELRSSKSDVLCLQECPAAAFAQLSTGLPGFLGVGSSGLAVVARASTWVVVDSHVAELSSLVSSQYDARFSPDLHGSSRASASASS